MGIKEIDQKIREIERKRDSIIIGSFCKREGETDEDAKRRVEEAEKIADRLWDEQLKLTQKKLDLITGAREFVEFIKSTNLDSYIGIGFKEFEENAVQVVKLFLRIPKTHRNFVLKASWLDSEAKVDLFDDPEIQRRHKEWVNKFYKPLKKLCKEDIEPSTAQKAKMLDKLVEEAGIDYYTLHLLLQERNAITLEPSQYWLKKFQDIPEDEKIRFFLKSYWERDQ